jgi:hypothetical protein
VTTTPGLMNGQGKKPKNDLMNAWLLTDIWELFLLYIVSMLDNLIFHVLIILKFKYIASILEGGM